jgi:hypothetical protein
VAALQLPAQRHGEALRRARLELGVSQMVLAREINRIRARRRLEEMTEDAARIQISRFECDRDPVWPAWRPVLAEALETSQEQLFGLSIDVDLPQPLLRQAVVTEDVVQQLHVQRLTHIGAENIFGPVYARAFVDDDLATIEQLIRIAPTHLHRDVRRAAALIAELGGWIAQDSGDQVNAERLTSKAEDHAQLADRGVQAMILMRRANILTPGDPRLGTELASRAANLLTGDGNPGRLAASIARQEARAALATHDAKAFREHSWYAAELATAEPARDELAIYATPAYVASETASGLIVLHEADHAIDLLQPHVEKWPGGQQRDHAVARARLLLALVEVGDYPVAAEQSGDVLRAYQAAPSARARSALRRTRQLLRDRSRSKRTLHIEALRKRLANALRGDDPDA